MEGVVVDWGVNGCRSARVVMLSEGSVMAHNNFYIASQYFLRQTIKSQPQQWTTRRT